MQKRHFLPNHFTERLRRITNLGLGGNVKKPKEHIVKLEEKINKSPTTENRIYLKHKSKVNKQKMNKYINKYHRLHENKLRSLESHNLRDYWKYARTLNQLTPRTMATYKIYITFMNILKK